MNRTYPIVGCPERWVSDDSDIENAEAGVSDREGERLADVVFEILINGVAACRHEAVLAEMVGES